MSHIVKFNNDEIEVDFNFHGANVQISVQSDALGTIEDSTALAADYMHMLSPTKEMLEDYAIKALAFYAYHLANELDEIKNC